MVKLKILIAILIFYFCDYAQALGSSVHLEFKRGTSLAIPTSGSISYNKEVYGLCKNSKDKTTVECNIYANSTKSGKTVVESCPVELSSKTKNASLISYYKNAYLASDDKVLLVWLEKEEESKEEINTYLQVILHINLIDLKKCSVVKSITHNFNIKSSYFDWDIEKSASIIFLADGSFQVGYLVPSEANPNLRYYAIYDKNGNVVVPGQTFEVPEQEETTGDRPDQDEFVTLFAYQWQPISINKGHFFLTQKNQQGSDNHAQGKLSVLTPEKKVKFSKDLGDPEDIKALAFGHERFAYCTPQKRLPKSIKCSLVDDNLNTIRNVTLSPGFGMQIVQLFVLGPNELLVLVGNHLDVWILQAYKINSEGKVSKPVPLDGFDDYVKNLNFITEKLFLPHVIVSDDQVCFNSLVWNWLMEGYVIDTCINKQALDTYA